MAKKKAKKKSTRKTASRKTARKAAPRVDLGAEVGIRDVADLHQRLVALVDDKQAVTLAGGSLTRVDFSILQLLAAFVRDRREQGLETRWSEPAPALMKAAERVDLAGVMGLEAT